MLNRLQAVFESFQRRDVRYLVIGGIAAAIHGVPRATFDLDIVIEASVGNARRLLDALVSIGFGTATMITAEGLLTNEITVFNDRVRVDVQTATPGIVFAEAWARRRSMEYNGQSFHVLGRDDLIASKLASGRPVDLEDVRILQSGAGPT
jgi:hypothetical protein